jgi:hypothetical protein
MRGRRFTVAFTTVGATAIALIAAIAMTLAKADLSADDMVDLIHTPNGGLQPQAVADGGLSLNFLGFIRDDPLSSASSAFY